MTKRDIVVKVSKELGVSQTNIQIVFDEILKVIKDSLEDGEKITIQGFGTFCTKDFAEKQVHSPRDGSMVTVPARRVVKFKSTNKIKI